MRLTKQEREDVAWWRSLEQGYLETKLQSSNQPYLRIGYLCDIINNVTLVSNLPKARRPYQDYLQLFINKDKLSYQPLVELDRQRRPSISLRLNSSHDRNWRYARCLTPYG